MQSELLRVVAAYLHALGVATYLGGSIVMEFVVGPAQKAIPPAQAQVMGQKTADRFLWLVWGSLALIPLSGILRLFTVGSERLLYTDGLWSSSYGRSLMMMEIMWLVLVINGSIITFVLRPKLAGRTGAGVSAAQVQAHQADQMRAATWIQRLTRIDLGIALVTACLGASLAFGGIERIV